MLNGLNAVFFYLLFNLFYTTFRKTRRKRKESEGMMLQADGTPFDWFGDGNQYSLHGFIDDATLTVLPKLCGR